MADITDRQHKARTGIEGLDVVLAGGLPANHMYLVQGDPGTGKTTLALQFLMAGRALGEPTLYITLSETASELAIVAASHGWTLDEIRVHELGGLEEGWSEQDQYTVFHPADVELSDATSRVLQQVRDMNPVRVVLDSLSEIRMLARDPLRYRRHVLALKQFFAERACTVLMLDDKTGSEHDMQLQSICHGVINMDRVAVEYGGARRRIFITKMRGLHFVEGYHDFVIEKGGLRVFPRLVATKERRDHLRQLACSGVPELDELLGGGIHFGTSTLILGPAGCGKSTLVSQYGLKLAEQGEKVAYFLFEETRANFLERARGLGMNIERQIKEERVLMQQIDPTELSPGEFADRIRRLVDRDHFRVIVIDSLNGYLNAMPSENFLLIQLHELLTYLNNADVLTLIVMAQHGMIGPAMQSPVDITYLADSVVMLRYFEALGEVRQAVTVVKKRTGGHERLIREFRISPRGLEVGEPLRKFKGVITGNPVYLGDSKELLEEPPH